MLKNYNLKNIHDLFKEGFSESELRGIYFEQPVFRPVFDELSKTDGIAEIVHQLIEYARRRLEFEPLLTWAKEHNPKRYKCHQPYEDSPNLPASQAKTTQRKIKINLPNLLQMLGSNIYTEPDVAVREMIQNAHDTCIIRQTNEPDFVGPQIKIAYNRTAQTLTFDDNGAGMTEEELEKYLSTVGGGLTKVMREKLKDAGAEEALLLIGQFGIGILSAFSVANRVEVFTRSHLPNSTGLKWACEGDINFIIEPTYKPEIGTHLVLHLNNKGLALLEDDGRRLKQVIKKYADFISIPIFLENYGQVNSVTPPWHKGQQANLEQYLFDRYGLHAIEIIRLDYRKPVQFEGLLFVPLPNFEVFRDFGEVDIYIRRVFITDRNKELLPSWARFIKGIINSASLTPTLSRDALVKDDIYEQVRTRLGEAILNHLEGLAKTQSGLDKLEQIVIVYNNLIKASALQDDAFFRRIASLVRITSENSQISIQEYLTGSGGVIYYFSKHSSAAQQKLLLSEKKLSVIDASWGVEEEFLEKYARLFGVPIKRLEFEADLFFDQSAEVDDGWHELEKQFELIVGVETKAVTFDSPAVPAVLVDKPLNMEEQLDEFSANKLRQVFTQMKQQQIDHKLLHLNIKNKLMQELRTLNYNDTFKLALTVIYNNALMLAQSYLNSANLEKIFVDNNTAFSAMIRDSRRVEELEGKIARMEIEFGEQMRQLEAQKDLTDSD